MNNQSDPLHQSSPKSIKSETLDHIQAIDSNQKTIKHPFIHSHTPEIINQHLDSNLQILYQKCIAIATLVGIEEKGCSSLTYVFKISDMLDMIKETLNHHNNLYKQIQAQLQKQEEINRSLIKKQLEMREQQKQMFDEINELRKKNRNFDKQTKQLIESLKEKQLHLQYFKNEAKASYREKYNFSQNNHYLYMNRQSQQFEGIDQMVNKLKGDCYYSRTKKEPTKQRNKLESHHQAKNQNQSEKSKQKCQKKNKSVHLDHQKRRKSEDNGSYSKKQHTKRKNSLIRK